VTTCGHLLKTADFQNIKQQEKLRESVSASEDYIILRRVLGLYPITRLFVSHGVSRWHAEARERFSTDPPANWQTIRYVPIEKFDALPLSRIVEQTKRDALGIPKYTPKNRQALFRLYAPVWEIHLQGDHDRIGTPFWAVEAVLKVDTGQPVTYTLLSFTRFGNEILTQLNYIIWFPSRPREGAWDLYGGVLDGVNYRVTLDQMGKPLIYETMHNCGCYYKAFHTDRVQVRSKIEYAEPPLIFEAPDMTPSNDSMVIAMESRTHYVQHLYPLSRALRPATAVYSLSDYGRLRSLKYQKGDRRSMFRQDSIAPGSERQERFILWPTGVLSPGAMRQWGRHAVAFAGKRHFDDPFYMDQMFEKTDQRPSRLDGSQ
jgi:hypothetical protein